MIAIFHIAICRKPLSGNTVAENVVKHGVGGLNIDGCRVGTDGATKRSHQEAYGEGGRGDQGGTQNWRTGHKIVEMQKGRFPANLITDGSDEVMRVFPIIEQPSFRNGNRTQKKPNMIYGKYPTRDDDHKCCGEGYRDSGSASRFFKKIIT